MTAISKRLQNTEEWEQAIQQGTYVSAARPQFWDVNHGTFEAAIAQIGPISREFRRIYDRLRSAKDIAEQPTVPRGDESAVTRRLTNGDLMQIGREINVATAPLVRVKELLANHLYTQGGGYIGNSRGHAPPAGARLVHIEGTMVPPPEPNPDAATEDEGEDMAGRGMPVNRHMDAGKLTHEWRNRRYGW
jgi:hypothetical protein